MHVMQETFWQSWRRRGTYVQGARHLQPCEEAVQYHNLPSLFERVLSSWQGQNHLLHSEHCRRTLIGRGHFVDPVGGWGSTQDRGLADAHESLLPPLQGEGPMLPAVLGEEVLHDLILGENIYQALAEREDLQTPRTLEQIIRDTIYARSVSWTSCSATLAYLDRAYHH